MNNHSIEYYESGSCQIPALFENVAKASALLKTFCQRKCLDETLWPQVDLAFSECLNNAIEHGCKEDPNLIVYAGWKWEDDVLQIHVEDPGEYFEFNLNNELPDNPLSENGRGYFIIRSIAEECKHEETEYGQKITLRIMTHLESDILNQVEEMYEMIQGLTNNLNEAYAEQETISGLVEDMMSCPAIESIIEKGVSRLSGLIHIDQVDVWTRSGREKLENVYRYKSGSLATSPPDIPLAENFVCSSVVKDESIRKIEDCSTLDENDPVYVDTGCALVCPIIYQNDCIGAVALHSERGDRDILFNKLLPLVKVFTQLLGLAFTSVKTFRHREEQERSQTQLQVASEIQQSLLPSSYPDNSFCKATGRCEAAMAVGGDYFDAIEIRDAGLLIVIADVMGKGVPAALLATIFRTAIRSRLSLAETPAWLLSKINEQIHEELGHLDMFITAQAAFLTYDKKMLKLASAGHCPAFLLNPESKEVVKLDADGMPLGVDPDDLCEERLIELQEGSRVLFITDGLYEVENPQGEMLGIERLSNELPNLWRGGLDSLPDRIFEYVAGFSAGRSAQDDKTLMALEIL